MSQSDQSDQPDHSDQSDRPDRLGQSDRPDRLAQSDWRDVPKGPPASASGLQATDLDALKREIDARIAEAMPERWNPNPDEVRKALMKLVLTLAEFIRQLLERQAVRRMENDTLTPEQIEAVGIALMRIEEAVQDIARQNELDPKDLNLDLGPLGRLL